MTVPHQLFHQAFQHHSRGSRIGRIVLIEENQMHGVMEKAEENGYLVVPITSKRSYLVGPSLASAARSRRSLGPMHDLRQ